MSSAKRNNLLNNRLLSFLAGPVFFIFAWTANPFNLDPDASNVMAVAILMITWWITEAVPIAVTALLPILLFPAMGVLPLEKASAPYGNQVVFLFLGGFMLGLGIEKWNLHKRLALNIVYLTGTSANRVIFGFMLAAYLLSMWLSNTATTMMMLPIAASVIKLMEESYSGKGNFKNFALCMMLGIAYASSIGGISTIIGTPPNVQLASYLSDKFSYTLSFFEWMLFCTPLAFILLLLTYALMVFVMFPNKMGSSGSSREIIRQQLNQLGPMTSQEIKVLCIFIFTALCWIFRTGINELIFPYALSDTGIALIGTFFLFVVPAGNKQNLLEWKDTKNLSWGILLLFGGGLSLANALEATGIITLIAQQLEGIGGGNAFLLSMLLAVSALFLTEVMSNVALVTVYVPVVSSIAMLMDADPLIFAVPVTIAASCAFMLPMATPPNAIVFASGHIKISQMAKAGFLLNLISALIVILFCYFFIGWVFSPVVAK